MQQLDVFDLLFEDFKLPSDRPIRLFESFAGIGTQKMGLERAGFETDVVGISEIDKFAIKAYETMHGEVNNLGSITDIEGKDMPKDIDIFTYSFPCTDLSKAGQQQGMGCGTRSGLVYEVMRILEEMEELNNLPQVLIMENVIDLIQAKFVKEFNNDIQLPLEKLGYTNYVFTLNAKDFGVPQNRVRVFMVSILGQWNYVQPKPIPLKIGLKDVLEENVDEKYFLTDKMMEYLNTDHPKHKRKEKFIKNQKPINYEGVANTITTRESNVVDSTFIKIKEATEKGYAKAQDGDGVDFSYLKSKTRRGRVQKGMSQTLKTQNNLGVVVETNNAKKELCNAILKSGNVEEMDMIRHSYTSNRMNQLDRKENENNISATLTTRPDTLGLVVGAYDHKSSDNYLEVKNRLSNKDIFGTVLTEPRQGVAYENLRIRKLTPRETGRLMGIDEYYLDKQLSVMSNAQAYKQHGNAIVVDVFAAIVKTMKKGEN